MSCQACKIAQQSDEDSLTKLKGGTYIRVGNGNILIVGCQKHLEEMVGHPLLMMVNLNHQEE